VVRHGPQHAFFDRLGSRVKERHVLHGFFHDTLGERDRSRALDRVRAFLVRVFAAPRVRPNLIEADQYGPTREEADALAAPLARLSPRGLYWAATRASLRFGGLLAEGIRLGHATGFDSGSTLDYIYLNQASGRTPLGRWIDRTYLDAIGWRGIRQRKLDVEALLREAIARLRTIGVPVHIVDIAAGHGRYVLEAVAALPDRPDSILLRDYSALNVERGTALIHEKGLAAIARFAHGDAFDRAGLATLAPRPTLGVVSGLYELVSDNASVRASLGGLADAVAPGGFIVYTGQPWHPQLELIARALSSHRQGAAWVMRRRTQEELDQLVAAAGFRKLTQRIGESGIFSVSLAQRVAQ
jgi:SAM-dependent methyltransferase